jgi:hypothetical protein
MALAGEQPTVLTPPKPVTDEASFQPSKDTKRVLLNPADPSSSMYVVVGTGLDSK